MSGAPAQTGLERSGTVRNTSFALASQLGNAALTAALTLFLARALEPSGYGIYALAISIGTLLSLPSDFGVSSSAARYIAEHTGDRATLAGLLGDALRIKLVISSAISLALLLLAPAIASAFGEPGLAWPLRAMSVALFGQSLMMLWGGSFVAMGRVSLNFVALLAAGVTEAVLAASLVLLGAGAAGATWGRAAGYAVGASVAFVLLRRLLGPGIARLRRRAGGREREIVGYAGPLLLIDAAFSLFTQLDVLLIGALLTATQAGLFQAPLRLVTFLHYPGYAVASGVVPRLARRHADPGAVPAFVAALRLVLILQGTFVAGLVAWAQPLTSLLLGTGYEDSASALRALAPFVFLSGVAPIVALGANYLGRGARRLPLAIGAVLINLVLDLILIPRIGIVAGAVGSAAAYALYVPGHLAICHRALDLPLRALGLTTLRVLLAAAAATGALAAAGTSSLSVAQWLLGLAGAAVAYAAVLLLTREVRPAEARALLARVRR